MVTMEKLFRSLGVEGLDSPVSLLGVSGHRSFESEETSIVESFNPTTGESLARVRSASIFQYEEVVADSTELFKSWREVPAPVRGQYVRRIGERLRKFKPQIAMLITIEMGKTYQESLGEVQEMIDMAHFAVGLSRQLYGLTIKSERPKHMMLEQWHPIGPVAVITAFNFPVAVWAWNAFIALVCGNTVVWKPSSKTPLCALAVQEICKGVFAGSGFEGACSLIIGEGHGQRMVEDHRFSVVSFTGSTKVGRKVGTIVQNRFGRSILELGGNNASVVMPDADLKKAVRASVFAAIGTGGQRCTSLRRLIAHRAIADELIDRLVLEYEHIRIGDPLKKGTTMGPLVDEHAVEAMQRVMNGIQMHGGNLLFGDWYPLLPNLGKCFVQPAIVEVRPEMPIVQEETFAPILYVMRVDSLQEAIAVNNGVPQGLSSSIFTNDLNTAMEFISATGSDCGIANVNCAPSGAEIGGAFGGEKETGGGREAGSDAWKGYMRRTTSTIPYGDGMVLAQGIKFGRS